MYLLETPKETYQIRVVMRTSAWGVYKGKGILLMEVWSESDKERAITTNDLDHFYFHPVDGFMVVNPQHYRRLTLKQTMDSENVLLEQGKVIDFPLKPSDLSRYDEVLYD